LHEFFNAADGNDGDDEKERDEIYALLKGERRDRSTLLATHRSGRRLRTPRNKARADNKKEHHPAFTPSFE
jgi:hypothetical protein